MTITPFRVALAYILMLAAAGACSPNPPVDKKPIREDSSTRKTARVETVKVEPSYPLLKIYLPGEIEGYRDAKLSTTQGGMVEAVKVQAGQLVKAGTSLALIGREVAEARQRQAKAQLDLAQHRLDVAKAAGKSLAKTRRVEAQTQFDSAEAAYHLAALTARRCLLLAPFDGVVSQIAIEVGEVVAPGMPLIRLVQIDRVKATMSISDRDIRLVQPGVPSLIRLEGGGDAIEGQINRISPTANLKTRTFIAETDLDNKDHRLLPGMMVSAQIRVRSQDKRITIPQDTLITRSHGNGVFVVKEGVARWRDLKLGSLIGHELIIEEGLEAGESVVMRGHRELNDGDRVVVVQTSMQHKDKGNESAQVLP
jgi:membrane fusion protein, multidrug efflux system